MSESSAYVIAVTSSSTTPGSAVRSATNGASHSDTRGCGVESSREPHWLQISALRGFGWRCGQSFRP